MIINSLRRRGPRTRRTVIGLMVAVMGARMVVLALAAVGVMSWGGSGQAASWMPLVLLPMLVIVLVLLFGRRGTMHHLMFGSAPETPLELLQRRFARGELTKEEYEEMKNTLLDSKPAFPPLPDDQQQVQ